VTNVRLLTKQWKLTRLMRKINLRLMKWNCRYRSLKSRRRKGLGLEVTCNGCLRGIRTKG
jgi:hypothetical protein